MTVAEIEVGKVFPWPFPSHGMRVALDPTPDENGLEAFFIIGLPRISAEDEKAFSDHPLRIGIVPFAPIMFFLFIGHGDLQFDAPFAIGIHDPNFIDGFMSCAEEPRSWPENTRRPVNVAIVDSETRLVKRLRTLTFTLAWWVKLADAMRLCPQVLSREAYREAMQRAYAQWPTITEMIAGCTIIEMGGI